MKHYILLTLTLLCCAHVSAQCLLYDVDFITYFDNREGGMPFYSDKTLFGTRLAPEIGVGFVDNTGGQHSLIAGAAWTQPIGKSWRSASITPTLYYRYAQKGFGFAMGFIPWRTAITDLPDYLMSDSLWYATPNIRGAQINYVDQRGYAEILCDWRALPTPEQREAFRIIGSGQFHTRWFACGGYAQLNHLANAAAPTPRAGVCDDITVQPYVQLNFGALTPLDSLTIRCSYIGSWQRDRWHNFSNFAHGFLAEFYLHYKFVGLNNTLYAGQPLMPLYATYGTLLNQGTPLYNNSLYNRSDIFFYIVRRPFVNVMFSWNFHYSPQGGFAHQQQLIARFSLDGIFHPQRTPVILHK